MGHDCEHGVAGEIIYQVKCKCSRRLQGSQMDAEENETLIKELQVGSGGYTI